MRRMACALVFALAGCADDAGSPAVVVYTALDADFSRPIFERFTAEKKSAEQN